jgi:5-methylcytosine-specific restriction endonuclease McrA
MTQYERSKRWKAAHREHVATNQQRYRQENGKEVAAEALKRRRGKTQQWFDEYKKGLACTKCGEDHPACIVFHHLDPAEKKGQVPYMVSRRTSLKTVLAEIQKCVVLCFNCHAKEHARLRAITPGE